MVQWNRTDRTLHTKIVYYGPALGGKTTNLQQIHRFTDPDGGNRLISLNTASDRTLFFDLLPLDLGRINGYSVKIQLYTVPGQVRYEATRRVVLSGADAVVFVADSQPGKGAENRAAWENLRSNLKANGLDPDLVPIVVQYNKRDLPGCLPPKEIEASLRSGREGTPAAAIRGSGVMETFRKAVSEMLRRIVALSRGSSPEELERLEEQLARALGSLEKPAAPDAPTAARAEGPATHGEEPSDLADESSTKIRVADEGLGEDLLVRSLRANLGIAEQYGDMREVKNRLERRVGELESLQTLARELSRRRDAESILTCLADAALTIPGARGAAVLTRGGEGARAIVSTMRGLGCDPLTAGEKWTGLISRLLGGREPELLDEIPPGIAGPGGPDLIAALSAPLDPALSPAGVVIVLGSAPFAKEDLRFLGLLAAHAAVSLDNAAMTESTARYNDQLETQVKERTDQLERAFHELRELDRMKDRFLSSISHEMRTPLTGIRSGCELLLEMTPTGDERREFVTMVAHEAGRLSSLVDRILRFQVLGQAPLTDRAESIAPFDLVSGVLQEIGSMAAARQVEISVDIPEGLPELVGDSGSLAMALREVADNAVKFSPPGGRVEIEIREKRLQRAAANRVEDGQARLFLVIYVRDRGPGIPEESQGRIFERFEQLGDLLTSKPDGLGLGLPTAREIVRRHGGEIKVRSIVGAGSEFRIYIPIATPGAAIGSRESVAETA